jgi:hypothetical protein
MLIISKDETAIRVSIDYRNKPLWQERKQDIFIRRQARPMCPVLWRMRRRMQAVWMYFSQPVRMDVRNLLPKASTDWAISVRLSCHT